MKILISIVMLITSLTAGEIALKKYFTNVMKNNKFVDLISVDILGSKVVPGLKDYKAYFIKFKVKDKKSGKTIEAPEKVFFNGKFMSSSFINITTGQDLKMSVYPDLPKSIYNKEHLISGDMSAKNKIVVFSDPRCPSCKTTIPEVINFVIKNIDKVALYYYHFPLTQIHPKAEFISKLIIADIIKNNNLYAVKKAYLADFDLTPNLDTELLLSYNKQVGSNLTISDVSKANNKLKADIELANKLSIAGTPAIFLNGNFTREYTNIIK